MSGNSELLCLTLLVQCYIRISFDMLYDAGVVYLWLSTGSVHSSFLGETGDQTPLKLTECCYPRLDVHIFMEYWKNIVNYQLKACLTF